jgi:hypothetical protein
VAFLEYVETSETVQNRLRLAGALISEANEARNLTRMRLAGVQTGRHAEVVLLSHRWMKSGEPSELAGHAIVDRKENQIFDKDHEKSVNPIENQNMKTIHVLSVGSMESGTVVRCALLGEPNLTISIVTNYLELWTIPNQEVIHLVILNKALSAPELEASSRLIRQRWPRARILVVRAGEGSLEDALYDDCVTPADSPEMVRSRIECLLVSCFETSRQDAR